MRVLALALSLVLGAGIAEAQLPLARTDGTAASVAGAPTISSCGTTPSGSAAGTDEAGTITIGGGAVVTCTLTFSTTRSAIPPCIVGSTLAVALPIVVTTTSLVIAATLTGGKVTYFCPGL